MALSDAVVILLAFYLAPIMRAIALGRIRWTFNEPPLNWNASISPFYVALYTLSFLLCAYRYGLYSKITSSSLAHEMRLVTQGSLISGLMLCGAPYMFHTAEIFRLLVVLLILTASAALCLRRAVSHYFQYSRYTQGINLRNVAILGTNQLSYAISEYLRNNLFLSCHFAGFIAIPGSRISTEILQGDIIGSVDDIHQLTRQNFLDEVVIAEYYPAEDMLRMVEDAQKLNINLRAVAGYYGELTANASVEYLGVYPLASLHRTAPRTVTPVLKRMLDIVLSLLGLLILFVPMAIIALVVRLDSGGPVLYVSERIGKRGRVFSCLKFRSMVKHAEEVKKDLMLVNERDGIIFKATKDPRITRIGKVLRKYSLDELPQLVNVLRGEMSMVGPRPPIASEVAKYKVKYLRRLDVMPGLTGLWQVRARQDPSFAKYIAHDLVYVKRWSLWLDLKILLQTVNVVLRGTGV
jgi:exopolysaccharide biosynthesis polyprenyl glycosylphosphotransferase